MTTIIERFAIDLSSKELAEHLQQRAAQHEAEAERLGNIVRRNLERSDRDKSRDDDDEATDGDVTAMHAERDRARELRFLAEHVVPDATYRLDGDDLSYLELVERTSFLGFRRWRRR